MEMDLQSLQHCAIEIDGDRDNRRVEGELRRCLFLVQWCDEQA
jgi:hypothetical protein